MRPFTSLRAGPVPATTERGHVARASAQAEAARAYLSELAAKFPMSMTIAAEFTSLLLPPAPSVPLNQVFYHSLIDFDPWQVLGQDIVVFGIWCDMLSCNPTPTTPASEAAWGNEYGLGAAIIVGDRQVPGTGQGTGQWVVGPGNIVGVNSAVTATYNELGTRQFVRTFPTGKYTTGTNKRGLNGAIVPFVQRIARGNRLRAAFVLNRTDANNGASKTINGYVSLEVYFGLTKNPVNLND